MSADVELERIREALEVALISEDADGSMGPTDALLEVAPRALEKLGNNGAATTGGAEMGGLEAHGKAVLDASENIARGLHDVADAIRLGGPA